MLQAYRVSSRVKEALQLFNEMSTFGIIPSEYTLSVVLTIIGESKNLQEGLRIHSLLKVLY